MKRNAKRWLAVAAAATGLALPGVSLAKPGPRGIDPNTANNTNHAKKNHKHPKAHSDGPVNGNPDAYRIEQTHGETPPPTPPWAQPDAPGTRDRAAVDEAAPGSLPPEPGDPGQPVSRESEDGPGPIAPRTPDQVGDNPSP